MRLSGTVIEIWRLKVHMLADTHTRNDGQNDQSLNLLQCSLRSHLAEINIKTKTEADLRQVLSQDRRLRPQNLYIA